MCAACCHVQRHMTHTHTQQRQTMAYSSMPSRLSDRATVGQRVKPWLALDWLDFNIQLIWSTFFKLKRYDMWSIQLHLVRGKCVCARTLRPRHSSITLCSSLFCGTQRVQVYVCVRAYIIIETNYDIASESIMAAVSAFAAGTICESKLFFISNRINRKRIFAFAFETVSVSLHV